MVLQVLLGNLHSGLLELVLERGHLLLLHHVPGHLVLHHELRGRALGLLHPLLLEQIGRGLQRGLLLRREIQIVAASCHELVCQVRLIQRHVVHLLHRLLQLLLLQVGCLLLIDLREVVEVKRAVLPDVVVELVEPRCVLLVPEDVRVEQLLRLLLRLLRQRVLLCHLALLEAHVRRAG